MSATQKFKPMLLADAIRDQEDGQVGYIYQRSSNEVFRVDGLAVRVCYLLDGSRGVQEIVKTLAKENRIPSEDLTKSVSSFISELEGLGLIRWVEIPK